MGDSKHTPGPWKVTNGNRLDRLGYKAPCVFIDGGPILPKRFDPQSDYESDFIHRVCELFSPWVSEDTPQEEQSRQAAIMEANARLIAAAPAMLEALQALEALMDGEYDHPALVKQGPLHVNHDKNVRTILEAALAAATGQA